MKSGLGMRRFRNGNDGPMKRCRHQRCDSAPRNTLAMGWWRRRRRRSTPCQTTPHPEKEEGGKREQVRQQQDTCHSKANLKIELNQCFRTSSVKLERVLGLTVSSNASLATAPSTGKKWDFIFSNFAIVCTHQIIQRCFLLCDRAPTYV